jgi:osmoprotectant transport system ATP-binding protein
VNGLLFPTTGEVVVDGMPTRSWDPIRLKRQTGYVIQEVGLLPHFDVERNVGLVPRLEGWPEERIRSRVEELLRMVGLPPEEFASRRPRQLSGGQRQRVGVARALAANPPLLLLDEPFGALDPVTRLELQRQFRSWRDDLGKTCLLVTHDVREALLLGSRIALLHEGRIEALATPGEFRRLRGGEAETFLAALNVGEAP